MKSVALIIALVLFAVTLSVLYAIWYAVRGQRDRHRRKAAAAAQDGEMGQDAEDGKEKKSKKKMRWGVEKDAYCYPEINDVMGFEFVSVINVPDDLKGKKKEQQVPKKKRWEESDGTGGLVTVSHTESLNTMDPNETIGGDPDEEEIEEQFRPKPIARPGRPSVPDNEEEEDVSDISAADLEFASKLPPVENWDEWPNNDAAYIDDDDKINSYMEAASKDIDSDQVDEDRKKEEAEAARLLELFYKADEMSYDEMANDILS